jgi:hypothetical protein
MANLNRAATFARAGKPGPTGKFNLSRRVFLSDGFPGDRFAGNAPPREIGQIGAGVNAAFYGMHKPV